VNNFQGDAAMSLATFRKDISIEVYNLQAQKVLAYNVFRCWVSEYQALAQLDAGGNAVLIATLKLENEGWVRDTAVTELKET
jgi:phage tail-like protein